MAISGQVRQYLNAGTEDLCCTLVWNLGAQRATKHQFWCIANTKSGHHHLVQILRLVLWELGSLPRALDVCPMTMANHQ